MNARQLDFIAALEAPEAPARLVRTTEIPSTVAQISEPAKPVALPDLEDAARSLLRGIGCMKLAGEVRVCWHARLRTTAGQAYYARCLVRMNPKLLQFGMEEVDKTLRHELAHLAARHRAGRRRIEPHGSEWRQACRDLGLPDEQRCHNLPLPRARQRIRHCYRCPGCGREYQRARPFRKVVACLECCRAHSRGRYDARYRLVKIKQPIAVPGLEAPG